MILGFLRLMLFGFLGLSVAYVLLSIYSRSVRREWLEKRFDEGDVPATAMPISRAGCAPTSAGCARS